MHRKLVALAVAVVALSAACGERTVTGPGQASPLAPSSPTTPTAGLAGTWVGQASDSSGTVMGAGMSPAMMGNMTWQITRFTGTMQFPGYSGHGPMSVSGTIDGTTATFTMTMPGGMMGGTCTATATGTFDIDALFKQMHGTYAGTNGCRGPFSQGRIAMARP